MSGRRREAVRVRPRRSQRVDALFLAIGSLTALVGLGSTYPGIEAVAVGFTGLLLSIAIAHLVSAYRLPGIVAVVVAILAFYLLGPPLCLRGEGLAWPTPSAWGAMTDQLLFGWKELLTTLPPVDGSGPLLVLPFVLGLVTGLLGTLLARVGSGPQWLRVVLPVLAPLSLLAVVILLGLHRPYALWLSGTVSAAAALGWLVVRAHRTDTQVVGGSGRATRLVVGAVILALAGAAASPVATWATGGGDAGRVVFRNYVEPPFDVGQYASPLSAFRRYVKYPEDPPPNNLYDKDLVTVEGVPAGSRLRIATLDDYDGVVWGASNNAVPGAADDTYRRVGPSVDDHTEGRSIDARITIDEGYSGVWVPLVGALRRIDFLTHADEFAQDFRFNPAAEAGVMPTGLQPGDRYTISAVIPDERVTPADRPYAQVGNAAANQSWLEDPAAQWTKGLTDPMKRVFAIADHLRTEGKYSDGVSGREIIYLPGHYANRLDRNFLSAPQIVGNDEQYAAAMALLANYVGVPARVVFGAVVPSGGVVRGSDVSAWVELRVADGSWRVLPTEDFMGTEKPSDQQTQKQQQRTGVVIPPPAQVPPPSTLGEQTDTQISPRKLKHTDKKKPAKRLPVPGWLGAVLLYAGGPLLALALVLAVVVGLKLLRRRRRRSTGPPSSRIVGGWRDLVDHARDLGLVVPGGPVTRREQSLALPSGSAAALARRADVAVFASRAPDQGAVESFWGSVAQERHALSRGVSRRRRWLGAVDPRSLWRR